MLMMDMNIRGNSGLDLVSARKSQKSFRRKWLLVLTSGAALTTSAWGGVQPERITAPPKPPEQANAKPESAKPKEEPAKTDPSKADAAKGDGAENAGSGKTNVKAAGVDTKMAGEGPATEAAPFDDKAYPVTRFLIEYKSEHPDHPPVDDLLNILVPLGSDPDGFVGPKPGVPVVQVRPADVVEGPSVVFHRSAINAIARGVIEALNDRGIIGVFVQIHPEDINDQTGEDLRGGKRGDLRLIVWTGKITGVRTLASGDRLGAMVLANPEARINPDDSVHRRVVNNSPVAAGDLIRQDKLDDYIFRLNRHPGRRVDVAVAPAGEAPENVVLDYLVAESKPWSVYGQISNTGTKSTSEWRERFGFVHNQLSGRDDVLRIDYITSSFDKSNALLGSYELPLVADKLKMRVYGNASKFKASDVGLADENFEGDQWGLGAEVVGNIYQRRAFFLDAVAGVRFQRVFVRNGVTGDDGQANFLYPYLGLKADRITDSSVTYASAVFEFQSPSVVGTDFDELQSLGRLQPDDNWISLKYDVGHSFYLEPLFERGGGARNPLGSTLAHEFAFSARGQHVFNDQRLIPNEEEIAGGLYTVRGYPESVVAGDNLYLFSAEYRFHVPQVFGISQSGHIGSKEYTMFGPNFRYAPSGPYTRTDWDLIFKAFIDHAEVKNNRPQAGELDHSLTGAGLGMEFQWKRNVSFRMDWGVALNSVEDSETVDSGDNRFHFVLTVLY
jgi:hemolysin activation/secretion protein